jgi:hypothetical protein
MVFDLLLHPERAARLAYQDDFDGTLPGLTAVLRHVTQKVWEADVPRDPYDAELQRLAQQAWTDALVGLAARDGAAPAVRARVTQHLRDLQAWLDEHPGPARDEETVAHRNLVFDQLDRYLFRLYRPDERRAEPTMPPGAPIGGF